MKYQVKIVETLSMTVEVEASTAEEAINQIGEKYWNEEIVVESKLAPDVDFTVQAIE